ncbi:MAG TPA: Crp/Fnr family transcriptional regulator [Pyrinomonadaceae bacterium]|nr:Crp/Fnr family transcriptional regulator [Pyrinomonadaceae bacterium]
MTLELQSENKILAALPREEQSENKILAALPREEFEPLNEKLKPVKLELGTTLYRPEQKIDYVYFVTRGVVSLLAALENGATVEAGVIGPEGMAGIAAVLGADSTPNQALVQGEGHALRMSTADIRIECRNGGKLRDLLLRYTHTLFTQVAQTAACNRLHTIEQRLARWLLLTQDRVASPEFTLTQDFLSRMLGVRRAGVSVAANTLKQAGLIDYRRGTMVVLDRSGLEQYSCECYRIVREEYDRYLTP